MSYYYFPTLNLFDLQKLLFVMQIQKFRDLGISVVQGSRLVRKNQIACASKECKLWFNL